MKILIFICGVLCCLVWIWLQVEARINLKHALDRSLELIYGFGYTASWDDSTQTLTLLRRSDNASEEFVGQLGSQLRRELVDRNIPIAPRLTFPPMQSLDS